jgi:DNA-binding response OmpR family regulator
MQAHILVAEDEPKISALVSDYLRAAGMQVSVVSDGAEVLPAVARLAPGGLGAGRDAAASRRHEHLS